MESRNNKGRLLLDFGALGFRDVVMAGHYCYNSAQPALRPHLHKKHFEICILEQGSQTYFVGSRRYNLMGGDVFITKPGEIHSTGNEPEHKGRLYWLELRANPSGSSFLGLSPNESSMVMRRLAHLPTRHFHNGEILIPTLNRIFKVFPEQQNPTRILDLRNLLLRLILDAIKLGEKKPRQHLDPGIIRVLKRIEKYPAIATSIKTLAFEARMSASYFKKQFNQQVGMPPIQYSTQRRIECGKQMLGRHDLPVTRIAMNLGFATSQHFATSFKRLTGMTPREFRYAAKKHDHPAVPEIGAGVNFHPVT